MPKEIYEPNIYKAENHAPFFRMSLADYYGLTKENKNFIPCLERLQQEQISIITPLGWMESSSYLEALAMSMSEVWEVYSAETLQDRRVEVVDIILRIIILAERLRLETGHDDLTLSSLFTHHTVIDNRFVKLGKKPERDDWLFALYNKMGSAVNMLRGEKFEQTFICDLVSCLNQVLYLCFLFLETLIVNELDEVSDKIFLETLLGLAKFKIERNREVLPKKNRYK